MIRRNVAVFMEPACWTLFEHYLEVLNKQLESRGLPRTSMGSLMGALTSVFLLDHRAEILEEYDEIQLSKNIKSFSELLGPNNIALAGLDSTTDPSGTSEAPELPHFTGTR